MARLFAASIVALALGCTAQQSAPASRDEAPQAPADAPASAPPSTIDPPAAPEPLPPAKRPLSFERAVAPASGDPAYLLIDHQTVLRLDDAGWQTIWAQEHIRSLALDAAGTLHVFDGTGVHALSAGAMRTLLAFEGGSVTDDRRYAIEGMRRFALGSDGDLWFSDGAGEPGLALVRRDESWTDFPCPALDELLINDRGVLFGVAREGGIVHLGPRRGWARAQPASLTNRESPALAARLGAKGELFVLYEDGLVRLDRDGGAIERIAVAEGTRGFAVAGASLVTLGRECTLQRSKLGEPTPVWEASLDAEQCDPATLQLDERGRVWVATDSSAIAIVNPDATVHALPREALPGRVQQLLIDKKGPLFAEGLLPPRDAQLLAPAEPAPASQPSSSSSAPSHYSWQLGTKSTLEDAKLLRDQLDASLRARNIDAPTYVLARGRKHLIMAGDFADPRAAERHFYVAKELLGEGGFIRSMADFCPIAEQLEPGVHHCKPGAVKTLELAKLAFVPNEAGEPPPLVMPPKPARYVVVVITDKPFVPGGGEPHSDAAYRSYVWQPSLGSLPANPSDDAAMLEIHEAPLAADPRALAARAARADAHDAALQLRRLV